jgi:hypothetical protein
VLNPGVNGIICGTDTFINPAIYSGVVKLIDAKIPLTPPFMAGEGANPQIKKNRFNGFM